MHSLPLVALVWSRVVTDGTHWFIDTSHSVPVTAAHKNTSTHFNTGLRQTIEKGREGERWSGHGMVTGRLAQVTRRAHGMFIALSPFLFLSPSSSLSHSLWQAYFFGKPRLVSELFASACQWTCPCSRLLRRPSSPYLSLSLPLPHSPPRVRWGGGGTGRTASRGHTKHSSTQKRFSTR